MRGPLGRPRTFGGTDCRVWDRRFRFHSGALLQTPRVMLTLGVLLLVVAPASAAQGTAVEQDSARAQIQAVLRAFYLNLANQNWDALAAYVLSPKLLERRGRPRGVPKAGRGPEPAPRPPPPPAGPPPGPSSAPPPSPRGG